jgi:hypothetical protein
MTKLIDKIANIEMPDRIARLPVDERGYPVPKFVQWIDGAPDFRVLSTEHLRACVKKRLCWICGDRLGVNLAFTIGPMCSVNRVSSEPPSHLECAEYAVRACPFLTNPRQKRDHKDMPDAATEPGGIMLAHNPGVCVIWMTQAYSPFKPANGGILFNVGHPEALHWYTQGRRATRAEIDAAIEVGLPKLRSIAEEEGTDAVSALNLQIQQALHLLPAT